MTGLDAECAATKVFHAGTRRERARRCSPRGGRVLCVCALGEDLRSAAAARAYQRVGLIDWPHAYCRRDIGHRALAREGAVAAGA